MKKLITVMVVLGLAAFAQATLTNEGIDYTQVTATTVANGYPASMKSLDNWWVEWIRQYEWTDSTAEISWNLQTTKGSDYDFSGAEISFTACNVGYASRLYVVLSKNGTDVWTSSVDVLDVPATHTWNVPTDIAYNGIDEISFVFSSVPYACGWGTAITGEMQGFTSTATQSVPEPMTLTLLGVGGLMFLRKKS